MNRSNTKARKYASKENILAALTFLDDALKRNCKETAVRKYLLQKQGFSVELVNEIFRLQRASQESKSNEKAIFNQSSSQHVLKRANTEPSKRTETGQSCESGGSSLVSNLRKRYTFLLPRWQEEGEELRRDFVQAEMQYSSALECLKDDWEKELSVLANERKIRMTIGEITKIFQHIPRLLCIHKNIYLDMLSWSTINVFCKRVPEFCILYAEYVRSCVNITHIMHQYIFDKRFQSCLSEIRKRSRCRSTELSDLLLVPLQRIGEYQEFLTWLQQSTDSRHTVEDILLSKAVSRIDRLKKYAAEHKKEIMNKLEMQRVQSFLGSESKILTPNRKIIRRGLITRRTTSWPSRKKKYFLFLFNDILLWSTVLTERQNAARLDYCVIKPSTAKYNPHLKFTVLIHKQNDNSKPVGKEKTLLFECKSDEQRNEWVEAIEKAIKAYKSEVCLKEPIIGDLNLILEEDSPVNEIKCEDPEYDRFKGSTATADDVTEIRRSPHNSCRKEDFVPEIDLLIPRNLIHDSNNSNSKKNRTYTRKSLGSIDNIRQENPVDDVHLVDKSGVYDDLTDFDWTSTVSRHSEWISSSTSSFLQNAVVMTQRESSKRNSSSDLGHRYLLSVINRNSQSGEDNAEEDTPSIRVPPSCKIRGTEIKKSQEMSTLDTLKASFSILLGDEHLLSNAVGKRRWSCYSTWRLDKI